MQPESTWNRVEQIFSEAMMRPPEDRDAFVRERCGADAAACEQVLELLRAQENMGGFLQGPMLDFQGQTFGAWRALEEVGRGGMSVVYRGERTDGDFEKRVAIKVILIQGPEMMRQREVQILAALEHPNVTRLLDAGTTPLGFRYLVMEFVEGVPITRYAQGRGETEKLKLFLQVCAGVQFAHRSLVVHRDIKPDNVLVTSEGVVKLLDFGIAKVLASEGSTAQTVGLWAYTADYASPEQILGRPVTTSADVYSLGVLLCELVGGRVPRKMAGLPLADQVTKAQQEEPADVPLLGDLAAVAHKALRREPAERYESVGALMREIDRYLAGRPVEAQAPTWTYRAGKFLRRNRWPVAAGTIAAAAIFAATGVALWQGRLAEQRFEQVRKLARSVMFDLHDAVKPLSGSLAARQMIVQQSLEYLDALARDKQASEEVQLDVVRGYLRLAEIEGVDFEGASAGKTENALERTKRAVEIARRVFADHPRSNAAREALVESLTRSASALITRNQAEAGEKAVREAIAISAPLNSPAPQGKAELVLARLLTDQQRYKDAASAMANAVRHGEEWNRRSPSDPAVAKFLAEVHNEYCGVLFRMKDLPGAEREAREAYRIDKERYAKDPRGVRDDLGSDIGMLAAIYAQQKRFSDAISMYEEQLALRREIAAEDAKNAMGQLRVAATLDRLAFNLTKAGRAKEAIPRGEESLRILRALYAQDRKNRLISGELLYALADLALAYEAAGEKPRGCALGREASGLYTGELSRFQKLNQGHWDLVQALHARCSGSAQAG